MNRRNFLKKIGIVGAGLVTVPAVTLAKQDNYIDPDIWKTFMANGFEWKLRYPGNTFRGGVQPGPWFMKHPLIGKPRSSEWDVRGEHKDGDAWRDQATWFYYNTGQLSYACCGENASHEYTLYLPYGKFSIFDIKFHTAREFQEKWDRTKPILIREMK